jgi:hypothetical protein
MFDLDPSPIFAIIIRAIVIISAAIVGFFLAFPG